MRLVAITLALTLFGGMLPDRACAQTDDGRYTLVLRGVELPEALEELARITEINLIYSSSLVAGRVVYCDGRGMAAETLLRCVLDGSGLDYVRSSTGTYVLIESLRKHPLFGRLAGRIVDRVTGEPLSHANVLLADASAGTTTDDAGFFHFAPVVTGRHRIHVTYLGYETRVDSLEVTPGGRSTIEIELAPSTLTMDPIVINGLTQRLPSRGLGAPTTLRPDAVTGGPLPTPDVGRAASGVAGVSMRPPLADLHIQGGDAGEHLTLIDGVPVRDPVTLGRHLSAFSPLAIDRITVHKAGFGAAEGSHLSGVVELEHDVSTTGATTAAVHVDPISVSGKLEGHVPLPSDRRIDGMLSLRSSMWDVFKDPGLETLLDRWNTVDPILAGLWIDQPVTEASLKGRRQRPDLHFTDLHAAGRARLSPFATLHASAYRATNRIGSELAILNADEAYVSNRLLLTLDDYDWTNWTGQARTTWLTGARSVWALQAKASGNTAAYRYFSIYDEVPAGTSASEVDLLAAERRPALLNTVGSNEVNTIYEQTMQASLSRSLAPNRQVELSVETTHVTSWFELGNQFVAPFSHAAEAWQIAGHVAGTLSLGLSTTLEPGLRLTYLLDRRTVYAEPRMAVRYDRARSSVGAYAVRLAGGIYRQFIPSFALTSSGSTSAVPFVRFWLPSDAALSPPRAYHLAAEALLMPDARWTIGVESYFKAHPRLLVVDYASLLRDHPAARPRPEPTPLDQSDFIAATTGRSLGGSLRVSLEAARYAASVHYGFSLSERRYPERFGGRRLPAPWNEPHRLAFSGRVNLSAAVTLNLDVETMWGRRWPLRRSYYDYLALQSDAVPLVDNAIHDPAARAVPAYADADVGVTYDLDIGGATIRVRSMIANVFNRHNVYDQSLEPAGTGYAIIDRALPGRRPVLSLRLIY